MPRKGKLERKVPLTGDPASVNKYAAWRTLVQELLASRWQQGPVDVKAIAGTVVGMFDAGAKDAEVAAFLTSHEVSQADEPWLTDSARMTLVRDLHESARSISAKPSKEEL
jgi:hypothetical protein